MSAQPAMDIDIWEWNPKVAHKRSNALFSFLLNRDEHLKERKGRRLISDQYNQSWAWAAHPQAAKYAKRQHSELTSMLARLTMLCHKQSAKEAQAVPLYMQYPKTAEAMQEKAHPANVNAFKTMNTMAEEEDTDFYTGMSRSELERLQTNAKVTALPQPNIENKDAFDNQEETDFYTGIRCSQLAGAEIEWFVKKDTQQKIEKIDALDNQEETDVTKLNVKEETPQKIKNIDAIDDQDEMKMSQIAGA